MAKLVIFDVFAKNSPGIWPKQKVVIFEDFLVRCGFNFAKVTHRRRHCGLKLVIQKSLNETYIVANIRRACRFQVF